MNIGVAVAGATAVKSVVTLTGVNLTDRWNGLARAVEEIEELRKLQ